MDWSVTQRQRLHSLFGVFFAPETTKAILSLVRPALRLTCRDEPPPTTATTWPGAMATAAGAATTTRTVMTEAIPLVTTRLGGAAKLPAGESWPRWETRPLDFLATVDFAELAAVHPTPGLPETGNAAFYYASTLPRPWGDLPGQEDGWRIRTDAAVPAEPPAGATVSSSLRLSVAPFLSLPGPGEPVLRALTAGYSGVSDVYEQLYAAWQEHVWAGEPLHQLGGWPAPVEGALDSTENTLLLAQFDSDDRLGWHWGDPGRVYFTLHASQRPDQAKLTLQAR